MSNAVEMKPTIYSEQIQFASVIRFMSSKFPELAKALLEFSTKRHYESIWPFESAEVAVAELKLLISDNTSRNITLYYYNSAMDLSDRLTEQKLWLELSGLIKDRQLDIRMRSHGTFYSVSVSII